MRYLPRCYNDLFMPEDEYGKKLNHDQSHDGYLRYINWLSEYLFENQITISDRQKGIVDICSKMEPLHAAIWLSDCCGYYLWERDRLEQHAINKTDYNEIVKEEHELWLESLTGDSDVDEPFEDIVTTQEEYESIKFDTKIEGNITNCPNDLDVPYRGVLKTIIMRCATKDEKRKVIQKFYDNFNETASK